MKKLYLSACFSLITGLIFSQGTNTPCSAGSPAATPLTVNSTCSYSAGTTVGAAYATNAANGGTPSCAAPGAPDVWFMFTAPASGNVTIDLLAGTITDSGMSLYSGSCGSWTEVDCDDDGGAGTMSMITAPALVPGATYMIRVWAFSSGTGTFSICVQDNGAGGGVPSNDEPCAATPVTVGTACNFSTYTNAGATNTASVTAPSCAFYSGGDVWFTVTVPASGSLTFDSNTGVILDGGMAIYSGTCGSLTEIACDDDGSVNGAMSYIAASGLTPGSTIWIRFWEYGGDNNGTFSLCVYDPCPPCAGAPTGGAASATPNPTTCATPNTTLSLIGASTGCNISYQWQSSPDNVTWTNITGATASTYTTPVTAATYFRCIVTCNLSSTSSNSTSVLVTSAIANVCSFSISTPAYSPDAAYTAGTLLTFPDDQMSASVPIGFSFCFMGTNYTSCVVSSNAFISFNTASAGGYSSWVTVAIPTATPAETLNSIMFPWHDVDPSVGATSDIRYLTTGTAPNRKFIVNFATVPMFSAACNSMMFTAQVVLNETTNIIETYIQDKVVCASWNSGNAVHGINGPDGCSGVVVPGRNNTQWTVTNDAKMFSPTGCCNVVLAAELTTFDGTQLDAQTNRIFWSTSTETNLQKFIIEKSEDGNNFSFFKEVNASGNSSSTLNYSELDENPFGRITYYRLKQVHFDGSVKYSNTVSIDNSFWNGFVVLNVFPNPADATVYSEILSSEEVDCLIEIKDVSGRILQTTHHTLTSGNNHLNFDLSEYESGIYFFNFIEKESGKISLFRVVKK